MISKLSVKKPFTVIVAVILVLILGVVSYLNLGVDLLPEMELPYVVVATTYPGASPDEVDQTVTQPLESVLASVSGLESLSSVSRENVSMIVLQFSTSMNMDSAMIELSSYVDTAAAGLPDGVMNPTILRINPSMLPVMILTADKAGMDEAAFTTYVEDTLQPALERVEGVASVTLMGAVSEQVEIAWDQEAIDSLNNRILAEVDAELAEAQQELDAAQAELDRGKAELESQSGEAYEELADLSAQLSDGRLQLQLGLNELAKTPAELEAQKQELLSTKETLQTMLSLLDSLDGLEPGGDALEQLEAAQAELDQVAGALSTQETALEAALAAYQGDPNPENAAALVQEMTASGQLLSELSAATGLESPDLEQILSQLEPETLTALLLADPATGVALAGQLVQALDQGLGQVTATQAQMLSQQESLLAAQEQLEGMMAQLEDSLAGTMGMDLDPDSIEAAIDQIDEGVYQIDQALAEMPGTQWELEQSLDAMNEGQTELEKGKLELSTQLSTAAAQLAMGQAQLDAAYEQFEASRDQAFQEAGLDGVLTTEMLSGILTASHFSMPAGYLDEDGASTLVKVGDRFGSLEELEGLLLMDVGLGDLGPVYLRDVADIRITDNAGESYARVNGNPGMILSIAKQSMYSTNDVSAALNGAMNELMEGDPDLHLTALMDQGYYIRTAVDAVVDNLLLGAVLAVLILIFFLRSVRPTLVIALSIPISLMGALALMYFSGVSLNVISLAGLATGVGMLVDNSIVVIENIFRLRSLGVKPATAAVVGAKQITGAIVASTLTTVCVFLPILFTHGLSRQLFSDMGLTVAYSLLASLGVALTLVPMLASTILTKPIRPQRSWSSRFLDGYSRLLRWTLGHKWSVFLLVLILAVAAVGGVAALGTGFIPEVDYGQVSVELTVPEGQETSTETLREIADQLTLEILEIPGISMVGAFEGSMNTLSFNSGGGGGSTGAQMTVYILCDPDSGLTGRETIRRLRQMTQALPVDCTIENASMDMTAMTGSGIQVSLYGEEGDVLLELATEVGQILAQVEGVADIQDGLDQTEEELRVIVDKNAGMEQGITVAQVYGALSTALRRETQAMTLDLTDGSYPVVIVDTPAPELTRSRLAEYPIPVDSRNADGQPEEKTILLGSIAEIQTGQGLASISRMDQQRYHGVSASIEDGYNIGLVTEAVEEALSTLALPAGYRLEVGGENEAIAESLGDLVLMILLAVVFIYLIMVAQFQSLLLPFIVLTTIPLAFTGGLLALILTGQAVSVVAMLGFLILAGIIVNNGIVFIDCVNQLRREEGLEKRDALVEAGRMRMRPILMTALTTIFGLGAMAFSQQMGSELLRPLALVAVGGMVYATALTLFFVPACYDVLQRKPLRTVEIDEDLDGEAWPGATTTGTGQPAAGEEPAAFQETVGQKEE